MKHPVVQFVLLCMLVMVAGFAMAQNPRTKTFPLGKEFPDQFAFCMTEKDATDIITSDIAGKLEEVLPTKQGKCFVAQALVTYKRLVFRTEKEGIPHSVYEAEVGGKTIFIPMKVWTAETT